MLIAWVCLKASFNVRFIDTEQVLITHAAVDLNDCVTRLFLRDCLWSIKVRGQTKDGETDGEWTQFYANGKLERISQNRIGKLVSIKVWLPNGQPCPHSRVENGNGIWNEYEKDGTLKERRTFRDGVELETEKKP